MSKLRSAKSKNIHEVVSFILSTALLSACSVGLDESSRVSGSGSGFDQFGRESSAEDAFSDQEITGGPAGPGSAFRSSAGTSSESQAGSSSSGDPSSDAASKSGDGAGTGDGTDAAQDASAADTTVSATDTTSTATADATASPSPSPSADASASSSEVPTCPNGDSNAIVTIYVKKAPVGPLTVLNDIGYQTCGGSSVTWLQGGATGTEANIALAKGVKFFKEARTAVGVDSYIVGFESFQDKDGIVYGELSPFVIGSGVTSLGSHSCDSPASSMVLRELNSDGSIKSFCLKAGGDDCSCAAVPVPSSPSTPVISPAPISVPTALPSIKVPSVQFN